MLNALVVIFMAEEVGKLAGISLMKVYI